MEAGVLVMGESRLQQDFIKVMERMRRIEFHTLFSAELTKVEFFALFRIHEHMSAHPESKGMYVSELACRMQVTSPAVSRMLRTLEERGLIERTVDRDDRRTTYIIITPEGEAARCRVAERMERFSQRVVERMGEGEMQALMALITRFSDIMSDELAKETDHAKTF